MIDKLYKIAEGLNTRFADGNDPFMIVTRLAEECGEVAAQVNHFECRGVKVERLGAPDRKKFAKELQDVIGAVLHLALYYDLQTELEASVDEYYRRVVDDQLNGGEFVDLSPADWELILPYLEENERLFGISVENDLLRVNGKIRNYREIYRKVQAVKLQVLSRVEQDREDRDSSTDDGDDLVLEKVRQC